MVRSRRLRSLLQAVISRLQELGVLPFVGESVFAYGVLYVENAPLQPEGTAIAFGDVVLAGIRGKLIGPVQAGVTSAAHELMHVLQGRILGPLYPH